MGCGSSEEKKEERRNPYQTTSTTADTSTTISPTRSIKVAPVPPAADGDKPVNDTDAVADDFQPASFPTGSRRMSVTEFKRRASRRGSSISGQSTPARRRSLAPPSQDGTPTKTANKYAAAVVEFHQLNHSGDHHQPSARKMHTAVALGDHSIVLFGGVSRKESAFDKSEDLHASITIDHLAINHQTFRVGLNHIDWHILQGDKSTRPPASRATHIACSYKNTMYVTGTQLKNDNAVHAFHSLFATWRTVDTGSSNDAHRPRAGSGRSGVLFGPCWMIFGGEDDRGLSNDFHILNFEENIWNKVQPTGPLLQGIPTPHTPTTVAKVLQPRRDHSAVVIGTKMYVFGGFSAKSDELAFISFDASTAEWSKVHDQHTPKRRGGHSACAYEQWMVIFGGMFHRTFLNDLHAFNSVTGVWHSIAIPAPLSNTKALQSGGHERTGVLCVPEPRAFAAETLVGDEWYIHGGGDEWSIFSDFLCINVRDMLRTVDEEMLPVLSASEAEEQELTKRRYIRSWERVSLTV